MPTSVASSGKLKQQKLQNTIQNTHKKIKTVFIKTNSQNTHKKTNKQKMADLKVGELPTDLVCQQNKKKKRGKRLEYDKSHRLGLQKHPQKQNKKIIKDLNRTIRPGLGQKTKIKITKTKPKGSNPKNQKWIIKYTCERKNR